MNEERLRRGLEVLAERAAPADDALRRLLTKRRRRERRRRIAAGSVTAATLSLLIAIVVQARVGVDPPPTFGTGDPTPGTGAIHEAPIAFSSNGDVYIREGDGTTRRITRDKWDKLDVMPRIVAGQLMWVERAGDLGASVVWRLDLGTGDREQFVQFDEDVMAFDAHPVTDRLALIVAGQGEAPRVLVLDAAEGEASAQDYWRFPTFLGRGGNPDDDVAVRWSPDGSKLLVVSTVFDTARERAGETLIVLDGPESTVIPPSHATFGRWVTDDTIVARSLDDDSWRLIDVTTGTGTVMEDWPAAGGQVSVSPGGQMIVMQVDRPAPRLPILFVADLRTGEPLLRSTHEGLWPIWLDAFSVVATHVEACPEDCMEHWQRGARTFRLSVEDEETSPFDIPITADAFVYRSSAGDR